MTSNNATNQWWVKYITLCVVVTWLCMFGPLLSYFVAFHIMGMSAHDPVIDLGRMFYNIVAPLIWPSMIGGLLAPFIGIVTGIIALLTMKAKWRVIFPLAVCVLWVLVIGLIFLG